MHKLILLPILIIISCSISCQSQPISISFDRETLIFPIKVGEAVERYKLSFRSPGHYFREDGRREMNIAIVYQRSDYTNEHQTKEVLYDRDVISYVFKYDGKGTQSDSVKLKVEQLCHCKLSFTKDTLLTNPPSIAKLMPQGGEHYYSIVRLNEDVTVGFRNKPNPRGEIIPEVRFFYKQLPAQIRKGMMQY